MDATPRCFAAGDSRPYTSRLYTLFL